MDPGGNGATMNAGGEGGPGLPGRREDKQWRRAEVHRMPEDIEDRLDTTRLRHAQSMYHCAC
jgi:hypothetical protein